MRKKQTEPVAKIGHNSTLTGEEQKVLAGFVQEIERIKGEQAVLASDLSETYKAAKSKGFDTAALRHLIKVRAMEQSKRDEFQAAVDAYQASLGALADTPLGKSATAREFNHAV